MSLFQELVEQTKAKGERKDCVVKALAIIAQCDYNTAHQLCKEAGRTSGCSMTRVVYEKLFKDLGFELEPMPIIQRTTYTIIREHRVEQGTWMIQSVKHVCVIKDGVLHDWSYGKQLRIHKLYRVRSKVFIPEKSHVYDE